MPVGAVLVVLIGGVLAIAGGAYRREHRRRAKRQGGK
jgi:hypothetical protein